MRYIEIRENKFTDFTNWLKRTLTGNKKGLVPTNFKFPSRGLAGTRGDDVKQLQITLNQLGFNAGKEDGIYGPKTTMAVRQFQRTYGLKVDGDAGPEVAGAVNDIMGGKTDVIKPKGVGKKRSARLGPNADVKTIIRAMARKYSINEKIILAVAKVESNFNIDAVGDTDLSQPAYGVMQIRMPAYLDARKHQNLRWDWEDVKTQPEANIEAGVAYLATGRDVYGFTDPNDLVRFYNGGPAGPRRSSTLGYHAKVVRAYKAIG